ncbi:hypothetical protein GCM10017783_23700 [Deinococcus piscis]|uniref:Plasmid replication initiator protein n=1 Tax=Deinococcus piscis TaxID=394230 RepID=A0ABQ3KEX9_9DEIO|nr:replication initiator protein A [Deinococcus piscis]GHG10510.1 hypothetical protein GCM10017783_23700 [Deinococcus piscis]
MDIRINEMDLTRAGVISVQRTLPSTETNWQVDYSIGEVMYRVQGNAFYGRPHGQDADVLLAIQTLFFRAGCPDNNSIQVMGSALLAMSGHPKTGQYYTRLRESLLRLWGVKWTMTRTRWDEKQERHKGDTTATSLIAELRLVDQSTGEHRPFETRELSEVSPIEITLIPSFAASIRAGLFQMLDAELLSRLGQPQARSLYRVLQAHRVSSDGSLLTEITFAVKDWFNACGLEDERTDNAKRMLDLAHDRLKQEGYLHDVIYSGRGRAGKINYVFLAAPQPEMVDQLLERGITRPVAEALAADHPLRIRPALKVVDERLATGWKPRSLAASIVDAIRNPKKWGYVASESAVKAPEKKKAGKRSSEDVEAPSDPRETAMTILGLHLRRAPSDAAIKALGELDALELEALLTALRKEKAEALRMAEVILMAEL